MAHTCPECDCLCFCNGDIDDIDMGEDINCKHWRQCEYEDSDDDEDEDYFDDYDDEGLTTRTPINPPNQ